MPRRHTPKAHQTSHITIRCNNKHYLFNLKSNYDTMVSWLNVLPMYYNVKVHHVLFMSNHLHLLATPQKNNLGQAMSYFLTNLSKFLNEVNGSINHNFGSRYAATVILDARYLLNAIRYIYQNPVRAKMCNTVSDYRFSSWHQYLGIANHGILLEPDELTQTHFEMGIEGREIWKKWVESPLKDYESCLLKETFRKGVFKFTRKQYFEISKRKTSLCL